MSHLWWSWLSIALGGLIQQVVVEHYQEQSSLDGRRSEARSPIYRRRWFLVGCLARLCQTLCLPFSVGLDSSVYRFSRPIEAGTPGMKSRSATASSTSAAADRLAARAEADEAAAEDADRVTGTQALFSSLYPLIHELTSQTPETQATPAIPTMAVQSTPAVRPPRGC